MFVISTLSDCTDTLCIYIYFLDTRYYEQKFSSDCAAARPPNRRQRGCGGLYTVIIMRLGYCFFSPGHPPPSIVGAVIAAVNYSGPGRNLQNVRRRDKLLKIESDEDQKQGGYDVIGETGGT